MTFEYRQNPQNPKCIEMRRVYPKGGRPSFWRPYLVRQSEADALRLLAMLREKQEQDESMVRE
jgi:hypothetical protein